MVLAQVVVEEPLAAVPAAAATVARSTARQEFPGFADFVAADFAMAGWGIVRSQSGNR
jgi:hypothetical protein